MSEIEIVKHVEKQQKDCCKKCKPKKRNSILNSSSEQIESKFSRKISRSIEQQENRIVNYNNSKNNRIINKENIPNNAQDIEFENIKIKRENIETVYLNENKIVKENDTVKINLSFKLNGKDVIKTIPLKITETIRVNDIIKEVVPIFNDVLYSENLPIQLNYDTRKYNLKPSKKSGFPKDLPSVNPKSLASSLNLKDFSLVYDTRDLVNRIQKSEIFQNCDRCNNCNIF